MSRYDLTDFEWRVIAPLLPNKPRGVPRVDDRRVLNGIFWVLHSGATWRDLPERYGHRTTCYNRFVRRRNAGVWDRVMHVINAAHDGDIQMIDSTSVRAHQQAATAKGGGNHCLGRSRGGLTTKIHVVVDAQGLPVRLGLSGGQVHDAPMAHQLLDRLRPGAVVLADKAYEGKRMRGLIAVQGHIQTFRQKLPAGNPRRSPKPSIRSATSSSASSKSSNTLAASLLDTTSSPTISSRWFSSLQHGSGSELMSPRPS